MSYARSVTFAALLILAGLASPAAAHAAPPSFRVTEAALNSDPTRWSGACPVKVFFKGIIRTDGPGTVKYTFTRSDGATGPVHRLDFAAAGVQTVETAWTLGDARLLPHYEGWQAIKILSPNELESAPANFVIDCKGGEKDISVGGSSVIILAPTPAAEAVPALPRQQQQQSEGLAAYRSILPGLSVPRRRKFEKELNELKAFAEGLNERLKGAPKEAWPDAAQAEREFRELLLLHEPDADKRAERAADFFKKHQEQFMRRAAAAGIDMGAERQKLDQLVGIWPADIPPETLHDPSNTAPAVFRPEAVAVDDRPPVEAAPLPDSSVQNFSGPYTSSGTQGAGARAGTDGNLLIERSVTFAGSEQTLAHITQDLNVDSGYRRVVVEATVRAFRYHTHADALFAGYSSAEAIINLRVLEGTRVVASDRVSVARSRVFMFGWDTRRRSIPERTLRCEFVRPSAGEVGRYTVVVEFEGWVGAGGLAGADVVMQGTIRPIRVTTRR